MQHSSRHKYQLIVCFEFNSIHYYSQKKYGLDQQIGKKSFDNEYIDLSCLFDSFFQKKKMEQDKKFYQGLFILSGTFILGFSVGYQVAI